MTVSRQARSFVGFGNDSIDLPETGSPNRQRIVFVSFDNLHNLMMASNRKSSDNRYRINSRIVSLAVEDNRHVGHQDAGGKTSLESPVKIRLSQLRKVAANSLRCAQWRSDQNTWSTDGCRLVVSHQDILPSTECACDQLSAYALLSLEDDSVADVVANAKNHVSVNSNISVASEDTSASSLTLEIVIYLAAAACFLVLVVAAIQVGLNNTKGHYDRQKYKLLYLIAFQRQQFTCT